jgi:acyl-coenzyme A thioesterase 13
MATDPDILALSPGTSYGPLGFVLVLVQPGRSVWKYAVNPAHFNPHGSLHGGVMMGLLDTAMGFALAAEVVPRGRFNVVAEMSTRFLAPTRGGSVQAEASVIKVGKRLAVVEARATDESGALLATASATHTLLP